MKFVKRDMHRSMIGWFLFIIYVNDMRIFLSVSGKKRSKGYKHFEHSFELYMNDSVILTKFK